MKFVRFCLVGGIVFIIDYALFSVLFKLIDHAYVARWLSFCFAIYCNWVGNTYFTFASDARSTSNKSTQFSKFFVLSHGTGGLNLAVYSTAVFMGLELNFSFVLGVIASLFVNFVFAKKIIVGDQLYKETQ